jgi:HAD superfamily hydrolase (TIGR01509 family)
MIGAVLFDIDGTLLDWESTIHDALDKVLPHMPAEWRAVLPERLKEEIASYAFVRRGNEIVDRRHWMIRVDPRPPWLAALPQFPNEASAIAVEFRAALKPVAFADAHLALAALQGRHRLGILTNSPYGEESLAEMGFREFFEHVIVLGDDERKPRPAAFEKACRIMGAEPRETVNVGDGIMNDVEAALAAGVNAVWVDRYDEAHLTPEGARRITILTDLRKVIEMAEPD